MELTGKIDRISTDSVTGKTLLTLEIDTKNAKYDKLREYDKLSVKLSKYRKKRSLNANNYAWRLISEIAENQGITKEEVYRHYIKEIGVSRQIEVDEKAVDTVIHIWSVHGLGWIAERLDYGEHEGFVLINLYYGSSTYNTKHMSRLISNIVQDCKTLGIETMTPDELRNMISLWKSERK